MVVTLFLAFLIGVLAGFRAMVTPAIAAWATHLRWLQLERPLALIGSIPALIMFTLFGLVELVFDKLPKTPNRTDPRGVLARVVTGGLTGACVCANGGQSPWLGALLGGLGGVAGCYGGYHARKSLVSKLKVPDLYIALVEDLVTIAGSIVIFRQ